MIKVPTLNVMSQSDFSVTVKDQIKTEWMKEVAQADRYTILSTLQREVRNSTQIGSPTTVEGISALRKRT